MGIKMTTNLADIANKLSKSIEDATEEILESMDIAARKIVGDARLLNTYKDRTGNLRSSIGYQVWSGGRLRYESFEAHGASENGETGVKASRKLCEEVAKEYGTQTFVVLVAGMDYALYVESRGFDVITGPWANFTDIFTQYLQA